MSTITAFIRNFLENLLNTRLYWLCVILISLGFEFCGYWFQYVMDLKPCEMCVYERAGFAAILIIGLVVIIKPLYLKYLGIPAWIWAAVMSLQISQEHVEAETNIFAQCNATISAGRFWFPLDQWIPSFFNPTGTCGDIPWSLAGFSMPWWVRAIFIGYLTAIAVSLAIHFFFFLKKRRS